MVIVIGLKASSTINVNDEGSSGDTTTYKYIYSTSNSATPTTTFTSGSSYSQETGDGDYYLIATACDRSGNCTTEISNVFKLDNTAPSCDWSGESETWTKDNRTITVSGNDSGSGMKSGQSSNTWTYSSGTTQTANLGYTVSDNAGNTNNCSKTANVYVDKDAPSIGDPNMVKGWFANGSQKRQFNIPITESGSGIDGQPSISYYHSVQGSWSDSTLYWVKDSYSEHWYQAGFGYDSSTTNILSITVTTKDVAGNTSSRSFSCKYGTNTCS